MPTAILVLLAHTVPKRLWGIQSHTYGGEVQQAGEDNRPRVHGVHNVTTIKLAERPMSDVWVSGLYTKRTKRPSTSRLFRRNIIVETMPVAVE